MDWDEAVSPTSVGLKILHGSFTIRTIRTYNNNIYNTLIKL